MCNSKTKYRLGLVLAVVVVHRFMVLIQKYNISLAPRQFVDLSVVVEKRLSDIEANMEALQMNKPQSNKKPQNTNTLVAVPESTKEPAAPGQTNLNQSAPAAQVQVPSGLHPSVNVVPSTPVGEELKYKNCVPLPRSAKAGVKICIHPPKEDVFISKILQAGRLWEGDLVNAVMTAMKANSDIQLVDVGANIGVFTLSFAASGYDVMAVEMLPSNVHLLQTSLQESGLSAKVTIVNNALHLDHRTLEAGFYSGNVGGTYLKLTGGGLGGGGYSAKKVEVNTICMDDLVPLLKFKKVFIKMDIEKSEANAIRCASKFFEQIDVRGMLMEWQGKSKEDMDFIIGFMAKHGLQPSASGVKLIPVEMRAKSFSFFFRPRNVKKTNHLYFLKTT